MRPELLAEGTHYHRQTASEMASNDGAPPTLEELRRFNHEVSVSVFRVVPNVARRFYAMTLGAGQRYTNDEPKLRAIA